MAKVTGRITVKADGEILLTRSGWTFNPGGVNRNTIVGDSGVHGYAEETRPCRAAGNLSHTEKLDLVEAAKKWVDVTLLFETDTGQSYVSRGAWLTEPPELTAGEGETSVAFEGPPAERM